MPIPVGLIAAGIGGAVKMFKGAKQNRLANKVVIPDADYNTSPYAQKILGEANRLKNSRMPGMDEAGDNILETGATTSGNIGRNATSGAQALAMLTASQGITNNSFDDLNRTQNEYSKQMLDNWNNANQGMITEGDKVFADQVRKQKMRIDEKNALRSAATANSGGGMNDIINGLFMSGMQIG